MGVLASYSISIASEDGVVRVRTQVREVALRVGFDAFAVAAISTAASEITRNAWVHGGGGAARVEELDEGGRRGVRIDFRDDGPGIEDVERALRGGFSTRRSLGLGLSGTRRLVDEFSIDSKLGVGTHIVIAKWARLGARA